MTPAQRPGPVRLLAAPVTGAGADWSAAMPVLSTPIHLSLPLPFAAVPVPEVSDPMPPSDTLTRATCPACHEQVIVVRDVDTNELLKLTTRPVDEGHVAVFSIAGRAVARRYGRPALRQPAWVVHQCPGNGQGPDEGVVVIDGDGYDDESPALQQARWRQA